MKCWEFRKIMDDLYEQIFIKSKYDGITEDAKETFKVADEIANDEVDRGAEYDSVLCELLDNNLIMDYKDLGKIYKDADDKTFTTDTHNASLIYFANELRAMADMIENL